LRRHHRATVGVLLGILLGSLIMMWPFTQGVGGKALEPRSVAELQDYAARWSVPGAAAIHDQAQLVVHIEQHWPERSAPPITPASAALALLLAAAGFTATFGLSRLGDGAALQR